MVGERGLQHVVHGAQVGLRRMAVTLPVDEPHHHAVALPAGGVVDQPGLVRGDRPAHLPPGPHVREPVGGQPAALPLVAGERPGVDLLHLEPAGRAHLARLPDRPLDQDVGARPADRLGQTALDDVAEEHPATGPVVDAPPGADQPGVVAHHDVLPGAQPVVGDLDEDVVLARPGPTAALALVGPQQVGQPAHLPEVVGVGRTDGPSRGQRPELLDELLGVRVETALLRDHKPSSSQRQRKQPGGAPPGRCAGVGARRACAGAPRCARRR